MNEAAVNLPYAAETLGDEEDDGTMPENVEALRQAVIGHSIVRVEENVEVKGRWGSKEYATVIVLSNGKRVRLVNTDDCCAYTTLKSFFLHPESVEHAISGVATTEGYTTWHIFADHGDMMNLKVDWSCGNPFYYGYGFDISVEDLEYSEVLETAKALEPIRTIESGSGIDQSRATAQLRAIEV